MTDIFLSYAREDLERARDIATALQAEGWSVFWDRRIPPGRKWDEYIGEKLDESSVVVVLWSPHSVQSDWVIDEAAHGRDRRALIPITIVPAKLPFGFGRYQSADLCGWQPGDTSVEYTEVLVEIGRLAPRVSRAPEPAVSAASTTDPPVRPALPDEWVLPTSPVVHLVKVPAGSFLMGSDRQKDASASEREAWPDGGQGSVTLPDFYIGKFPVTVAQFKACVAAGGCTPPDVKCLGAESDHPVVNVSWREALQYCEWLDRTLRSSTAGLAALRGMPGNGWQIGLPSEAEWEKAARGTDGRTYPWGEGIDPSRANYAASKKGGPTAVGSFPSGASPYGALDMAGNVWEWTRSLYKSYPYVASDGREDLKASGRRVLRGGSFHNDVTSVRAANRDNYGPDYRSSSVGFRVVVSRF